MVLSDIGVEVICGDRKGRINSGAFDILMNGGFVNRGLRSLALDLKKLEAVPAVLKLASSAHGPLEGFRPRVM